MTMITLPRNKSWPAVQPFQKLIKGETVKVGLGESQPMNTIEYQGEINEYN